MEDKQKVYKKEKQKVYKLDIRATLTSLEIGEAVAFDIAETFPNPVRQIASDLKRQGQGCYKVSQNSVTKEVAVRRIA